MEAVFGILAIALYGAATGLLGWFWGRTGKDDYLSQQHQILTWQRDRAISQRDEAIQQRDALVAEISATYREVTKLWAHDAKRADNPTH